MARSTHLSSAAFLAATLALAMPSLTQAQRSGTGNQQNGATGNQGNNNLNNMMNTQQGQEVLQVLNSLVGLAQQAQQMGMQVPGLDQAIQQLVNDLTGGGQQGGRHHRHHHNGMMGGMDQMLDQLLGDDQNANGQQANNGQQNNAGQQNNNNGQQNNDNGQQAHHHHHHMPMVGSQANAGDFKSKHSGKGQSTAGNSASTVGSQCGNMQGAKNNSSTTSGGSHWKHGMDAMCTALTGGKSGSTGSGSTTAGVGSQSGKQSAHQQHTRFGRIEGDDGDGDPCRLAGRADESSVGHGRERRLPARRPKPPRPQMQGPPSWCLLSTPGIRVRVGRRLTGLGKMSTLSGMSAGHVAGHSSVPTRMPAISAGGHSSTFLGQIAHGTKSIANMTRKR